VSLGLAGLAVSLVAAGEATAQSEATIFGNWRNPKGRVEIAIRPCGPSACGEVVWATPKAQADARKGSGRDLIGQQLFRDFTPAPGEDWTGKVFVPDLNLTFSGSARLLDPMRLQARGCVLPGVLCKTQIWLRVEGAGSQ
jgi:uncharacterized protein (DUF2147 family)